MKCEQCGNEFTGTGQETRCPFCGHPLGSTAGDSARGPVPWEQRSSWLDIPAMLETWKAVLLDPVRTFRGMITEGDLGSPLLYGIILSTLGMLGGLLWNGVFRSIGTMSMLHMGGEEAAAEAFLSTGILLFMAVFSPVLVAVGMFISAGIYHLCLLILGGARNGFEATFRVVAYAQGTLGPFQLIPFCGGLICFIWGIVLNIIGIKEIHEISTGRAVLAVLLPLIVCCLCVLLFFTLGLGSAFYAGLAQQQM